MSAEVLDELAGLIQATKLMAENLPAARRYAATPEGREKALATQREVRKMLALIRPGLREMEKADKLLTKILRKPWGVAL